MTTQAGNGTTSPPSRDEVMRLATYQAAASMYYDTSVAAQKMGVLTISVMDMASLEPLPRGATHRFYVFINATACYVTRMADGSFTVEPDARIERQRQETQLRSEVLDVALVHFTESVDHLDSPEQKRLVIEQLLEDTDEEVKHPVIRDELPDVHLNGSPQPQRQWSVRIGNNYCEVGLFPQGDTYALQLV